MNQRVFTLIVMYVTFIQLSFSQENFKVMFYNILNYPIQAPANRIQDLATILEDYRPDIFMVCELNSEEGAENILNIMNPINSAYKRADFEFNTSDDTIGNLNELQNMIFYDSSKFILENQTIIASTYRDFNHYKLKLKEVITTESPIFLDVFVGHLKASSGVTNEQLRLSMVNDLVTYLESIPSDSYVIFGGDLNIYSYLEPAFQELIDLNNNITFVDPADRLGNWHNNQNYIDMFTQSTRTQSGLGGATGGFDDRFDFILTSSNMLVNTDISYVADSYKAYGNNGNFNCYNQEINSNNCNGNNYNQVIRNALYNMSDHLPVTLELQTSLTLGITNKDDLIQIDGPTIVTDKLQINIYSSGVEVLTIYNSIGQSIKNITSNNQSLIRLDVSEFAQGVYYILSSEKLIKPIKFIIK